jgi:dsRNA-specific ribonuclease
MISTNSSVPFHVIREFLSQEAQLQELQGYRGILDEVNQENEDQENLTYVVPSTGATLSEASSLSLLSKCCQMLPSNEFYRPEAHYFIQSYNEYLEHHVSSTKRRARFRPVKEISREVRDCAMAAISGNLQDVDLTTMTEMQTSERFKCPEGAATVYRCVLVLPDGIPLSSKIIVSPWLPGKRRARQRVAFEACRSLHRNKVLNDFLQPISHSRPPRGVVVRYYTSHSEVIRATRTYASPFSQKSALCGIRVSTEPTANSCKPEGDTVQSNDGENVGKALPLPENIDEQFSSAPETNMESEIFNAVNGTSMPTSDQVFETEIKKKNYKIYVTQFKPLNKVSSFEDINSLNYVGMVTGAPFTPLPEPIEVCGYKCEAIPLGSKVITRNQFFRMHKHMLKVASLTFLPNMNLREKTSKEKKLMTFAFYVVPLCPSKANTTEMEVDFDLLDNFHSFSWDSFDSGDITFSEIPAIIRQNLVLEDRRHQSWPLGLLRTHLPEDVDWSTISLHGNELEFDDLPNTTELILECRYLPRFSGRKGRNINRSQNEQGLNDPSESELVEECTQGLLAATPTDLQAQINYVGDGSNMISLVPVPVHVFCSLPYLSRLSFEADIQISLQECLSSLELECGITHFTHAMTLPSSGIFPSYESLEFLGDTILQLCTSAYVFVSNPDGHEGVLCAKRMDVTVNALLNSISRKMRLPEYLIGRSYHRKIWAKWVIHNPPLQQTADKTRADIVEALIGAVYLDSGIQAAYRAVRIFLECLEPYESLQDLNRAVCSVADHDRIRKRKSSTDFSEAEYNEMEEQEEIAKSIATPPPPVDVLTLENIIQYQFLDRRIAVEAMTHPTYVMARSYQRLEWIGDALLQYASVIRIYGRWPGLPPYKLHLMLSASGNNMFLGMVCVHLEIHRLIAHMHPYLGKVMAKFEDDLLKKGITRDHPSLDHLTPNDTVTIHDTMLKRAGLWVHLSPPKVHFLPYFFPLLNQVLSTRNGM